MRYEEIVAKVRKACSKVDTAHLEKHLAVQVDITGEGEGAFYIEVSDGKINVEPWEYLDNDIKISCAGQEIIDIVEGKKNFYDELTAKKIQVARGESRLDELNIVLGGKPGTYDGKKDINEDKDGKPKKKRGKNYKKVIEDMKAKAMKNMTQQQFKKASIAIHTASVAAGAAGFVPVPVADAVPISAAQVTMVVSLGKIFKRKISESAAKAVISAAASTFVGRTIVKLIPVVGWGISAAVAAGVTEAIGWTIAADFANGNFENVPKADSEDLDAGNHTATKCWKFRLNGTLFPISAA